MTAPSSEAVEAGVLSRAAQRLLPVGGHADDVYECVRDILTAAMPHITYDEVVEQYEAIVEFASEPSPLMPSLKSAALDHFRTHPQTSTPREGSDS